MINHIFHLFGIPGTFPQSKCCIDGESKCLTSGIDMRKVCDAVNNAKCGVEAVVSLDPGRYTDLKPYFLILQALPCLARQIIFLHVFLIYVL